MPFEGGRSTLLAVATLAVLAYATAADAQVTISDEVNTAFADIAEEFANDFATVTADNTVEVDQQVINGAVVDERFFPAVFGKMRSGESTPSCTASLIGPGTMLIAAHCVDDNPRIRLVAGDASVIGNCVLNPLWRSNADTGADIALCALEKLVRGVTYERLSFELPQVGRVLHFVGYGCTAEGQRRDGILRLGSAPAQNRPPGMAVSRGTLYTVALVDSGTAAGILCPGDSGGPIYDIRSTLDGPRVILGVNSATTFGPGVSLFAALGADHNEAFVRDFTERRDAEICGINLDLGCKLP